MTPEKALELASQYGIVNVVLVFVLSFLAWLVYYVITNEREREKEKNAESERRDERWSLLVEKLDNRTNERHENNQKAMVKLEEADRKQIEEHEQILRNQSEKMRQLEKISGILDSISARMKTN